MVNRKVKSTAEAEEFLKAGMSDLFSPQLFSDMPKAVALVKKAIENKERVMVFGDYDVDGITSTVLVKNTLVSLGLDVLHHIPLFMRHRFLRVVVFMTHLYGAVAQLVRAPDCRSGGCG